MRRLWLRLTIIALPALPGCSTYAPLQTAPDVGQSVELSISDRGRLELGDRLGRGVSSIEGRVTEASNDQYVLNVSAVSYLNGEHNRWSGEPMRLNREFVDRSRARKLSKARTWMAAACPTVVVVGFMASRGLLGSFTGGNSDGSNEPPPASLLSFLGFRF
jgi:hypothetical protein